MRAFFVGTAIPMIIVPAVSSIVRDNMPQSELGRMLTGVEFGLLGLLLRPRVRDVSTAGSARSAAHRRPASRRPRQLRAGGIARRGQAAHRGGITLKALRVDLLHEDDFASNMAVAEGRKPLQNARRASRSVSAGFLSHSWRDAAAPKYFAVNAWAADFYNKHEYHPRIWLDKACIDQANIEQSLACLPSTSQAARSWSSSLAARTPRGFGA